MFERLNSNTVPLNTQELRNCIYRGSLISLVNDLAEYNPWLNILGKKEPDKRMKGEELILRFFAFQIGGISSYHTPQKFWLNDIASEGRTYSVDRIQALEQTWKSTIKKCLQIFDPNECFRRLPISGKSAVINRALMDLTMDSLTKIPENDILRIRGDFRNRYIGILRNEEFSDLITRAVDHRLRTINRFNIWRDQIESDIIE